MTISSSNSTITVAGNGVQTVFQFSFIGGFSSNMVVLFNGANNAIPVTLPISAYTITLNNAAVGALWGVGGTVTYNPGGTPIPAGTSLTITRIAPLTQNTSISNQGAFAPNVIESALDILEMQIQQVSNRTTQFRGTWTTATAYNPGDIVQDGANGANTLNYYICSLTNTSDVWATDLANGEWSLSVQATVPSGPVTLSGAVTGAQSGGNIVTTLSNAVVGTSNIINGAVGSTQLATGAVGSTQLATGAVATTNIAASAVTLAKIQNASANSVLLGSGSSGSGSPYSELTLGTNLSMSGTTLNAIGGAVVLLGTANISNQATVDFNSLISSSYDQYLFTLKDIVCTTTTGEDLLMKMSINGGTTFLGSAYVGTLALWLGGIASGAGPSTSICLTGNNSGWGTGTADALSGWIQLVNPLSTIAARKYAYSNTIFGQSGGTTQYEGFGANNTSSAVNSIRFLAASGNLTSGKIQMYGIKNT